MVRSERPDETAFWSPARHGRQLRGTITPDLARSWRSVSFWDSREAAERLAHAYPRLGRWIAVVELPPDVQAVAAGPPGHVDVETEPQVLLRALVRVLPVR